MKCIMRYFIVFLLLIIYSGFAASTSIIPQGIYSYTQEGDELIDGQKASITWNIEVKNNRDAIVIISSWHAPFTCVGIYSIFDEKDYTILSWSQEANADKECDLSSPQIFMKESSGKILIRSKLFPWGSEDWQRVRKTH